jgi:hypothetical protein
VHTAHVQLASQDYRANGPTVALREQTQTGHNLPANLHNLALVDVPGLYAFEDSAQGQRPRVRHEAPQVVDFLRNHAKVSTTTG